MRNTVFIRLNIDKSSRQLEAGFYIYLKRLSICCNWNQGNTYHNISLFEQTADYAGTLKETILLILFVFLYTCIDRADVLCISRKVI